MQPPPPPPLGLRRTTGSRQGVPAKDDPTLEEREPTMLEVRLEPASAPCYPCHVMSAFESWCHRTIGSVCELVNPTPISKSNPHPYLVSRNSLYSPPQVTISTPLLCMPGGAPLAGGRFSGSSD